MLSSALPSIAAAQEAQEEEEPAAQADSGDGPSPDPGGMRIQYPRPRLLAIATLGSGNEYRDRLLSDRNIASLSGGVAWMGFALSATHDWELSTSSSSHEVLFDYSYKLPFVDVHAGFVVCGNDRMLDGCPDAARFTFTSNSIPHTTLEASLDLAINSSRHSVSASVTRDLWEKDGTTGAVRFGWTRTDYPQSAHLDGASIRLIAARRLTERLELDFAAGAIWTSGAAKPATARDGAFALTSLVWRY